jgi:stringent starvation protein B
LLSSKPYLIRALWSWCCDAGLTPYLSLFVDEQCRVPLEYVQDGTLTLNLSPAATGALDIGNDWVTLSARFGGVSRELIFPVGAVIGIFARENGAGMEFAYEPSVVSETPGAEASQPSPTPSVAEPEAKPASRPGRPHLQRVK